MEIIVLLSTYNTRKYHTMKGINFGKRKVSRQKKYRDFDNIQKPSKLFLEKKKDDEKKYLS